MTPATTGESTFRLRGVFSVLPTAFHDDGSLDLAGVESLVRAHLDAGVAGLTALGVMGEAGELGEDEREAVLARVLEVADVPVVVGVTGESSESVARRARDAAARGVSAVMVSPTRSLRLTAAVAAAAEGGVPIVVQDYLAGSGIPVDVDEIAALSAVVPLFVGVKAETPPTSDVVAALGRRAARLAVVGGLGGLFLIDELRAGAVGIMTGFAMPAHLVSIVAAFERDPAEAEREWARLLPLMRLEAFPPFSLVARKEAWRLRGVIGSAHCRRTGARLDAASREDVRRALEAAGG